MDTIVRRGQAGLAGYRWPRMMRPLSFSFDYERRAGMSSILLWSPRPLALGAMRIAARARRGCLAVLACAVAGVALTCAFTYEALFALAPIAIAAFLGSASLAQRRGFGFILGFTFGFACFASGLQWLFALLDGNDAPLIAVLLPLALFAALSIPAAVVGASVAGPRGSRAVRLLLIAPALWTAFDWLRHQSDIAFPWFSAGYSQMTASPLAGYAPIGGVLLVGLATVLVGSLLAIGVTQRALRGRAASGALAIIALGACLQTISWTEAVGPPLRIAILQPNIGAPAKFDSSSVPLMLGRYESLIRSSQADVMLLPESALPLPAHLLGGYLGALRKYAEQSGTDVVVGAFETDRPPGLNYSSAISLGASGMQVYRKRQLVPFGEFIPWGGELYRSVQRIPFANTARGKAEQPLPMLGGGRVAIAICYDDVFGERMRGDAAIAGWIANMSNDGWGDSNTMRYQHARVAQARALEFGRPWLRAADTGHSGLIDERGRWVDSLPLNEIGALEAEVTPRTGVTPYARWGDRLALALCAFALIAAVANRFSSRGAHIPKTEPSA